MSRQSDFERTMQKIDEALASGDVAHGLALAERLAQESSRSPLAWISLGAAQMQARRLAEAEASFRRALALGSDDGNAYHWLGNLLRTTARPQEAGLLLQEAAARWPGDPTTESLLGLCLLDLGRFAEAAAAFHRAERLQPTVASHAHNLARALERAGDLDGALAAYGRATRLAPGVAESHVALAQLLLRVSDSAGSAAEFRLAHRCETNTLRGGLYLAQALIEERAYGEAETLLKGLALKAPASDGPLLLLGRLQQRLGRFTEAEESLREALARNPGNDRLYFDVAYGRKLKPSDASLVEAMERRLDAAPNNPGRVFLDYALGKAYADLERYGDAMARFDAANAAMLAQGAATPFDATAHAAYFDELIATFTPEFFRTHAGHGDPSERPVFIVGMIRSGTTLVDQILSGHPQASSIDEHLYWPRHLAGFLPHGGAPAPEAVRRLAEGYLAILQALGGDGARVTNKLPTNYAVLGAIHLAFPNARIVHVRRNPIDNLLSIWQTRFPSAVRYAHDKANLVAYHVEYRRLMAHWRAVLPADRLLEIDYETLVSDGEPTIRRMVEFLGLPWDDRCLRPEANPHEIRTPSAWQARQPIFTSSVEKWRRYEPWLGEFAALRDSAS